MDVEESIANSIKEEWKCPEIAGLHWDGKLMHSLVSKYTDVERLPVLISGKYSFTIFPIVQKISKKNKIIYLPI